MSDEQKLKLNYVAFASNWPDCPICPLVSSIDSPTYKVAKFFDKIIKNTVNLSKKFAAINTVQFSKDIVTPKMGDKQQLFSLDIVDMINWQKLTESKKLSNKEINEIVPKIYAILKQNYFIYNGEFCSVTKGLAMRAPLSATL